jgi:hypothetical protein
MADEIAFHCYTPEVIPCPNCTMCGDHGGREPKVTLRKRWYRVMKSGKRVELTKEQYDKRELS